MKRDEIQMIDVIIDQLTDCLVMNNNYGKVIDLESYMTSSLYTESSNGRRFEWRKMIEKVKELDRPLTDEESKLFEIK